MREATHSSTSLVSYVPQVELPPERVPNEQMGLFENLIRPLQCARDKPLGEQPPRRAK